MKDKIWKLLTPTALPLSLFLLTPNFAFAAIEEWGDCVVGGVPTLGCLEVVFGNILFAASGLIIVVLFVMFVVGSISYLTSGGNPEKVKKAQATLMWAVAGTLLFLGAYLLLKVIDVLFLGGEGKVFKFEIPKIPAP